MQLNPELTERLPVRLTSGRTTVTELHISKLLAYIVQEERAGDILINPQRVFNFDKGGTQYWGPENCKSILQVSEEKGA